MDFLVQVFDLLRVVNHDAHKFVDLLVQLLILLFLGFLNLFDECCAWLPLVWAIGVCVRARREDGNVVSWDLNLQSVASLEVLLWRIIVFFLGFDVLFADKVSVSKDVWIFESTRSDVEGIGVRRGLRLSMSFVSAATLILRPMDLLVAALLILLLFN